MDKTLLIESADVFNEKMMHSADHELIHLPLNHSPGLLQRPIFEQIVNVRLLNPFFHFLFLGIKEAFFFLLNNKLTLMSFLLRALRSSPASGNEKGIRVHKVRTAVSCPVSPAANSSTPLFVFASFLLFGIFLLYYC